MQTDELEFTFDTAWSPPEPVFDAMALQFPELEFQIYCFDQLWNFACEGTYQEGYGGLTCGDATNELYEKTYGEPAPPDEPEDDPTDTP